MADLQQARKGRARRTDALRRWLQTQGVQCETALREATLFCSTVEELAWASPEDLTWLTEAWDPSDRATLLRAKDEAQSAIEAGRTPEGVVVEELSSATRPEERARRHRDLGLRHARRGRADESPPVPAARRRGGGEAALVHVRLGGAPGPHARAVAAVQDLLPRWRRARL